MSRFIIAAVCCLLLASCRPDTYTPKPLGYYQIELPQHAYRQFSDPRFPYTFRYPVYANIVHDTSFFGEKPENPYWINIDFPSLGGTIYVSYKEISSKQTFAKLLEDAHKLSFFHDKKANYIDDNAFDNGNGVTGVIYNVGGDAASACQFIATDSVKHFIRGALYFDVSPNADSLKPVNAFLRTDIDTLLKSMKWQ